MELDQLILSTHLQTHGLVEPQVNVLLREHWIAVYDIIGHLDRKHLVHPLQPAEETDLVPGDIA